MDRDSYVSIPATEVPCYDFNLDLPAGKRWKKIFDSFGQDSIDELRYHGSKMLSTFSSVLVGIKMAISAFPRDKILYIEELEYIAERCEMELHEVIVLQMVYEANSMCTSAVYELAGKKYFFRTMDWDTLFLKKYTIRLNVIKNSAVVAEAVGWLGLVGYFTATCKREKPYSISINFRKTGRGSLLLNAVRVFTGCFPVAYLLRLIINNPHTVDEAIDRMKEEDLISPAYFIVCDWHGKEDCIITRNCDSVASVRRVCLTQANCDIVRDKEAAGISYISTGDDILHSVWRLKLFEKIKGETSGDLVDFLKFPILNDETIYVYYMCDGKTLNCLV